MKLSLTARTSLITALLLTVCSVVAGVILYSTVRNSLREELEAQGNSQVAVLQSLIEVDDGRLQLNSSQPKLLALSEWRIATRDDQTLWSSNWTSADDSIVKSRVVALGSAEAPPANPRELKKVKADEEEHHVESDAWQLPQDRSLEVKISVRVPRSRMNTDLAHLSLALWTIGPLTVVGAAVLMALFLRWQLRPLGAMAQEAALIGPENSTARISPAGSATECVQLRAAINRMLERLESGLQRERNFAAIAAHELRSPLAQMRTALEVALRRDRENAEYRQTLSDSLGDVKRLESLAANLLLITRGFDAAPSSSVDVRNLLERARREANSDATFDCPAGMVVRGREELLVAAFRNVLENAGRYAAGTPARITGKTESAGVQIIVQDGGPGVPEHERERIFDPLIRLDAARTIRDETHGFGLGLTVARNAVRACGGELLCRARADGKSGAEFVFVLRTDAAAAPAPDAPRAAEPAQVARTPNTTPNPRLS